MPVQPKGASDIIGEIVLHKEYETGLKDLDGFNYLYLIYHFHETKEHQLRVVPFMDKTRSQRGVFSTRTPMHPNNIGLSVVELVEVKGNVVRFKGVDILDGTPLLDIKPYIDNFDAVCNPTSGWMKASLDEVANRLSDDRFVID